MWGTASFNNWTRFSHWPCPTSTVTPVMLPPGRNRAGGCLKVEHGEGAESNNQIWIPTNYLANEVGIMGGTPFAGISLDQEIAPFDIA
jgi:hypothetical protein